MTPLLARLGAAPAVATAPAIYTLINSWGKSWGASGRIQVTETRLVSMLSQAIVFDLAPGLRGNRGIAGPPTSASKTAYECEPLDQGTTSSCGGHGTTQILATASGSGAAAALCNPLGVVASPRFTYAGARRISTPATSAGGPALTDSGIVPDALITWTQLEGIVPIGFDAQCPTPDGRYSDVSAANINADVSLAAEITGRLKIDFTAYSVDCSSATTAIPALRLALATPALGLGIGIFVDTAFENWDPSQGPLDGAADLSDPNGGGHWICADAFEEQETS